MNLNIAGIVKKHRYETVCVVLAVVILLALWPASRLGSQARAKTKDVLDLSSRARKALNSGGKGPANTSMIEQRQERAQLLAAETKEVVDLFKSKSQRDFLVPAMFPKDGNADAAAPWQFRTDYNDAMDKLLNETLRAGWPADEDSAGAKGEDHALACVYCRKEDLSIGPWASATESPTAEDCWFAQLDLWIQQDLADVFEELNRASAHQRAQQPSVENAAVKRIMKIRVNPYYYVGLQAKTEQAPAGGGIPFDFQPVQGAMDPAMLAQGGGVPWQMPGPKIQSARDKLRAKAQRAMQKPFTQRFCNEQVDILHFSFSVVVDSRRVNELLAAVSRKNLYTILGVALSRADVDINQRSLPKFDSSSEIFSPYGDVEEGFVYGTDPVVRLDVDAEALFLRDVYADYMPKEVKDNLSSDSDEARQQRLAVENARQQAQAEAQKRATPKKGKSSGKKTK